MGRGKKRGFLVGFLHPSALISIPDVAAAFGESHRRAAESAESLKKNLRDLSASAVQNRRETLCLFKTAICVI